VQKDTQIKFKIVL